jgi:hypothetical protein
MKSGRTNEVKTVQSHENWKRACGLVKQVLRYYMEIISVCDELDKANG